MRADAVKNRQRILDAAEEVFAAEGLSVPIDVVAERAGVGVGTLYRHFPTKEALFEAIVITRLEKLAESANIAALAVDPAEAFFSFLRTFGTEASMKHDVVDALAVAGVDIKSRCATTFDELQAGLSRLLERAAAAGAVREDVTTAEVIGLVVGACHAAEHSGLGATPDRMIQVVCDGLRRR
jgi:AcrR family transcriptional regulator